MKNILIIALMLLVWNVGAYSQTWVHVWVQSPSLAGYDQYWGARYGLKNFIERDTGWVKFDDYKYYNRVHETVLKVTIMPDDSLAEYTTEFRKALKHDVTAPQSDVLYVFVGHNPLLDRDYEEIDYFCYDNMLFGCYTENWNITNTIVDTHNLVAPEGYAVLTGIELYLLGFNEEYIRKGVALRYAHYQKINDRKAINIFK